MLFVFFYMLIVGDLMVIVVSDGLMLVLLFLFLGILWEEVEYLQWYLGLVLLEIIVIGVYLICGCGNMVLVDIGIGGVNGVGGEFIVNLVWFGVGFEEIDVIFFIYVYLDYIGGLLFVVGMLVYFNVMVFLFMWESVYWLVIFMFDNVSDCGWCNVLFVCCVLVNCVV